jgi:hypothetical protein
MISWLSEFPEEKEKQLTFRQELSNFKKKFKIISNLTVHNYQV